jgi:mitogen-activated protein kinase 1/3/mitogen-activated protein kinase 6
MSTFKNPSQLGGPTTQSAVYNQVQGSSFYLDRRFTILETIGSGAYGVVVAARDQVTGQQVAIKKIEKAFEHATFTKRTLRELKILRLLNNENVMKIITIQQPTSLEDFEEIYMVSELMETDLSSIIKSPQVLSDDHCQFFLYQLLRGIKYIHSCGILHRDLKPRNILVNSNCDLKICDFGLARANIPELSMKCTPMTDYVATRWYRAPEVLLTFKHYTSAMDMWSVGCIFAELLLRKPLMPGTDVNHQLDLITSLLGSPSDEDIACIPNKKSKEKALKLAKKRAKNFEVTFNNANPLAVDLLKKLLVFNPGKRFSAEQALAHPYMASMHFNDDEPLGAPVSLFDFEFERMHLSMEELKSLIFQEIQLYHFTDKKEEYLRCKEKFEEMIAAPVRKYSQEIEKSGNDRLLKPSKTLGCK